MPPDQDSAGVRLPPPLYLLAAILMGKGFDLLRPLPFAGGLFRSVMAMLLLGSGFGILFICAWAFRKSRTALEPWKTTSRLITSGPYRWSRNPIYSAFILIGLGMAFALDSVWIALMQIPLVGVIQQRVIKKEERYLHGKFGKSYGEYRASVRRWI